MATLDAFFIRGKKKTPTLLQDTHNQHAFVNPFTAQIKKPSVPLGNNNNKSSTIEKPAKHHTKRNTIAHYFTPATKVDTDVVMEEAAAVDVCVIRNKIPVMNVWDMIQYELDQDPFYNDTMDEPSITTTTALAIAHPCIKRRRSTQHDTDQHTTTTTTKRQHRKTDHELSSIMTKFLNMGSTIKQQPTMLSCLDLMNQFHTDDVEEDLSRPVRYKQTWQESHLYLYHMTEEFLDFGINE